MRLKLPLSFLFLAFLTFGVIFPKHALADSVSGHVYDYSGGGVQSQVVSLKNSSGTTVATSTTDSSGSYTLTAAAGTYTFTVKGTNNSTSLQVPQNYTLSNYSYTFSGTTTFDISLPLKKVTIHAQDASNTAMTGVIIGGQDAGFAGTADDNLTVSGVTGFTVTDSYSTTTGPTTGSDLSKLMQLLTTL